MLFRKMVILGILAASPFAAFADGLVARQSGGGSTMTWELSTIDYEKATLAWSCSGEDGALDFPDGRSSISLDIRDLGAELQDGTCAWELRLTPIVPKEVAERLASARAAGDDKAARRILKEAGIDPEALVASGAFAIARGGFVSTEGTESGNPVRSPASPSTNAVAERPDAPIAVNDEVIPDDLIVQGSLCVGLDCVNNEDFDFDTIRLKENNLRIHFDDTSTISGYPANDWRIIANDSASGGASKFSVEDSTGGKTPLTIRAGAATNSIFVDSTGRVGFRTSTPVLDLHVNTSNTPAIRLEQNNSGGFTAQTWDIGANEANFFVRDVTGGSRLPLRIRPGAPTSSVDISASGAVAIGGASPVNPITTGNYIANLQVLSTDQLGGFFRIYNSEATYEMAGTWMPNQPRTGGWLFGTGNNGNATLTFGSGANEGGALTDAKDTGDGITITTAGNVGINCNAPGSDLVISATTNCSGSQSSINAGSAQFTVSSSRTLKENLEPVAVPDLLERIAKIDVYKYDFKKGPKDRLGLMAEDFHAVFERGSDKVIDGNEVQMALWLAVQQLTAQNKSLQEENKAFQERLTALEQQLATRQ